MGSTSPEGQLQIPEMNEAEHISPAEDQSAVQDARARVDQLLAWSRPPVWLGVTVELNDGAVDYSLEHFHRDH